MRSKRAATKMTLNPIRVAWHADFAVSQKFCGRAWPTLICRRRGLPAPSLSPRKRIVLFEFFHGQHKINRTSTKSHCECLTCFNVTGHRCAIKIGDKPMNRIGENRRCVNETCDQGRPKFKSKYPTHPSGK